MKRPARSALGVLGPTLAAAFALAAPGPAGAAAEGPRITDVRCVKPCAGLRKAAHESKIALSGRRLGHVDEVSFRAEKGRATAAPLDVSRRRVTARVPEGAVTGRVRALDAGGAWDSSPRALRVVPAGELPRPGSFALLGSRATPRKAFFDARREPRLRYRFRADRRIDLRIMVVDRSSGQVERAWTPSGVAPYVRHSIRWNGITRDGDPAETGRYKWRVARRGGRELGAGRFRLFDHEFPVRGPHAYGDRFGEPRSGGRTHEGQDLWAGCGTPLVAARGGEVQATGYSGDLYGWYVTVDGRGTARDQFYSHLQRGLDVHDGERVRTGERIGEVGRTGNARSEGCQLHFELWPEGWRNGSPIDPLDDLKRWDGWS